MRTFERAHGRALLLAEFDVLLAFSRRMGNNWAAAVSFVIILIFIFGF